MPIGSIIIFSLRVFPKHRIPAITPDLEMPSNDHRHIYFRNCYRNLRYEMDREFAEEIKMKYSQLVSNTNQLGIFYMYP